MTPAVFKSRLSAADQLVALFAATLLGIAFVLALAARGGHTLLPGISACWSVALFGRSCPGCGLTRSFVALAGGDLSGALEINPLGPVLFFALVSLLVIRAGKILRPEFRSWHFADVVIAAITLTALVARTAFFYAG